MSLHSDYNQMIHAGMFSQTPLSFEKIVTLLSELEQKINSMTKKSKPTAMID